MKKITSLFVVFSMIFSLSCSVFAESENSDRVSELILLVKDKIGISDEEYEFESYHENTYNSEKTYYFYWKSNKEEYSGIDVNIKADGTITSFYKSYERDYSAGFLNYSKDKAIEIAKDIFNKINAHGDISEPVISKSGDCYRIYCDRVHNNINVESNYINCIVSGKTGEVISYNLIWSDLAFEEENPISLENAKEIYKEKIGYELFYTVKSEDYKNSSKLVYKPKYEETVFIDAISGELKTRSDFEETSQNTLAKEAATADSAASEGARLSEKELELVDNLGTIISPEEAMNIAKEIEEFEIDDTYTLESSDLYRQQNGKYVVSIYLKSEKADNYFYKNISFDGNAKKLINYYSYSNTYDGKEKSNSFNNEKGKQTAEDFLDKYYKEEFSSSVPANKISESEGIYEYKRTINGIKVSNNGLYIRIDKNTGKITGVNYKNDETEFSAADNVQSLDKVYDKVLNDDNFKLKYIIVSNDEKSNNYKPVLVYSLENEKTFDAVSLEEISGYLLEPVNIAQKPVYTDISGHYAETYINRLLEEDIYLEGDELRPDDAITYKEFSSLLYMVLSGSEPMPLDELYKYAENYFRIKESTEKADEPITRLDAVKMLLDKMGYGEFALIEGIFNCPFEDIDEKDKGYGAIAAGLKLVSTADSKFYKDSYLKRCDALIIIYNYMAR